jgi:hypothetical protein
MDHNSNCFELFGLDFVIDEELKCWLIEVNMSPACAERKGQTWLRSMTEDMADGMLNLIENKILVDMASKNLDFKGPVEEKLNQIKKGSFSVDLKNWEKIKVNQAFRPKVKEK